MEAYRISLATACPALAAERSRGPARPVDATTRRTAAALTSASGAVRTSLHQAGGVPVSVARATAVARPTANHAA